MTGLLVYRTTQLLFLFPINKFYFFSLPCVFSMLLSPHNFQLQRVGSTTTHIFVVYLRKLVKGKVLPQPSHAAVGKVSFLSYSVRTHSQFRSFLHFILQLFPSITA